MSVNPSNSQRVIDLEREVATLRHSLDALTTQVKEAPGLFHQSRIVKRIVASGQNAYAFAEKFAPAPNGSSTPEWQARSAAAQVPAPDFMPTNSDFSLAIVDRGRWVLIPSGSGAPFASAVLDGDLNETTGTSGGTGGSPPGVVDGVTATITYGFFGTKAAIGESVNLINPCRLYGEAGTPCLLLETTWPSGVPVPHYMLVNVACNSETEACGNGAALVPV